MRLPTATLSSVGGCSVGSQVDFYVDLDGNGSFEQFVGSDMTDGTGAASTVWSGLSWRTGIFDVQAVFAGSPGCLPSSATATIVIVTPGDAANGGGWYQAFTTGSPRVNFGFTVRRQADGSYRGQLLWHNNEKWRIKGTLTSFGKTSPCTYAGTTGLRCGSAQGSGTLYHWNTTTLEWDPVQTVTYVISFVDGGSRKGGKKPDHFGINITNYSAASLPESAPQQLKGGNVLIP